MTPLSDQGGGAPEAVASVFAARFPPHSEGQGETWQTRYEAAWQHEPERMVELFDAMQQAGGWLGTPALVSWTGRVKDGHHRVICAVMLRIRIPYLTLPAQLLDEEPARG